MATNAIQDVDARQAKLKKIMTGEPFQAALVQTLPAHMKKHSGRIVRAALAAIQTAPKLLECDPVSIVRAILQSARLGLEPDGGPLGQGYLIPYGKDNPVCQFIPGYRGLIKMARNSGEVADVWAEVVYSKDEFSYDLGLNPDITHKRCEDSDPGELTHCYAVCRFRDGEKKFVVLPKREVDQIRASSKSPNKGPWVDWPGEMWKKTAIRRLAKYLPLSVDAQAAFESDEDDTPVDMSMLDAEFVVNEQEALPGPNEQ